jgi:hypothetical protein
MRSLPIFDAMWRGHPRPRNAYSKATFAGNHRLPFVLLVLLAALTPLIVAQQTSPTHSPARPAIRRSRPAHASPKARRSSPFSLLAPFLGDSFNPEDFSPNNDSAASQPPAMLLQAANALTGADYAGRPGNSREPSSNQPLLIELQGDRYVRVNNAAINGEALPLQLAPDTIHPNNSSQKPTRNHATQVTKPNPPTAPAPMIAASSPLHDLPPAVLVFQDGHSEEVREYTIADGFLYARGDFYTDGYWNKKIDLSKLNLPQTQQANSARNIKFALPSFPNEVITRP